MSIAELMLPLLQGQDDNIIHMDCHSAFSCLSNQRTLPTGKIVCEDLMYGMLVEGAIVYQDRSCIVYIRDPRDNTGMYLVDEDESPDPDYEFTTAVRTQLETARVM